MKKIWILINILLINNFLMGQTIFSDYKVSFGKIYLTNYVKTIHDNFNIEDEGHDIYYLNDEGEFHIHDGNGRELFVRLKGGILDGKYEELHTNGNIYTMGEYVRGEKEGLWKIFDEKGKILKEVNYKKGKLNGLYKSYHGNGHLFERGSYKDNHLNGEWMNYYETGEKKTEGQYVNGRREGTFTEFYKNGQIKNTFLYKRGIPDGRAVGYYKNGKILYEFDIKDRDGKIKGYNMDGTTSFEGAIENGRKIGTWEFYDGDGKILTREENDLF